MPEFRMRAMQMQIIRNTVICACRLCLEHLFRSGKLRKMLIAVFLITFIGLLSKTDAQDLSFSSNERVSFAYPFFYGQDAERPAPGFVDIGIERLDQERTAMLLLLGWGLGSLAAGSAAALTTSKYRDFALMNAGWGAVNAGIAAFALAGADSYTAATSFETVLNDEQFFNRILAVNSGLNVAYISVGFSMNYLGQKSRTRQFGSAVMVQGAFLFAFDAWLLWNSSERLSRLAAYPANLQLQSFESGWGEMMGYGIGIAVGF